MILYYKNSFVASFLSLIGCALAGFGIMQDWEIGYILAAIPFLIGGKLYSNWVEEKNSFKRWWKQITDTYPEREIARSRDLAVSIYRKNPTGKTMKKIRELNPKAAIYIENGYKDPSAPRSAVQPVQQPKPAAPAPAQQSVVKNEGQRQSMPGDSAFNLDAYLDEINATALSNTKNGNNTQVYRECLDKLERVYPSYPNHGKLRSLIASISFVYVATSDDFAEKSFDNRRMTYQAALKSIEFQPDQNQKDLDYSMYLVLKHAVHGTIFAVNSDDRGMMLEALDWIRKASQYRITGVDDTMRKLMGYNNALAVSHAWVCFWLAISYRKDDQPDNEKALMYIEECLRFCPANDVRQCDLNPTLTDTSVIMRRDDALRIKKMITG